MSRSEPPSRHESERQGEYDGGFEPFADCGGPVQTPADTERRVLGVTEVAGYCGVRSEEVLSWIDTGRLLASYVSNGGYRVAVGDFMAFFSRYALLV